MLDHSIADSTTQVYKRAWVLFQHCLVVTNQNKISVQDLPLSFQTILVYLTYLRIKGFAPATITTYVSAIGYIHKVNGLVDPTTQFIIQKTLSSINRLHATTDSRLPITQFILFRLLQSMDKIISLPYHITLLQAMFAVAFYGLFRIGEITKQKNGSVCINMDQVRVYQDRIVITIKDFKHNKRNQPFEIVLHKQNSGACPYLLLLNYLAIRGSGQGPLFRFIDGKPITRNFFNSKLKMGLEFIGLDVTRYKSHSLRIGGASYLSGIGLSDLQIKLMGRWQSDAFLRYIRNQKFKISRV